MAANWVLLNLAIFKTFFGYYLQMCHMGVYWYLLTKYFNNIVFLAWRPKYKLFLVLEWILTVSITCLITGIVAYEQWLLPQAIYEAVTNPD
jgi:hypothetical protein